MRAINPSKVRSRKITVAIIPQVAISTLPKTWTPIKAKPTLSSMAPILITQRYPSFRPIFIYVLNKKFALQLYMQSGIVKARYTKLFPYEGSQKPNSTFIGTYSRYAIGRTICSKDRISIYLLRCSAASILLRTGKATMETCPMKPKTKFVREKDSERRPNTASPSSHSVNILVNPTMRESA